MLLIVLNFGYFLYYLFNSQLWTTIAIKPKSYFYCPHLIRISARFMFFVSLDENVFISCDFNRLQLSLFWCNLAQHFNEVIKLKYFFISLRRHTLQQCILRSFGFFSKSFWPKRNRFSMYRDIFDLDYIIIKLMNFNWN